MADEKDIASEEPAGGGRKKLLIIAGAALALLLGAGAAAYFLVGGDDGETADGATPEEAAVVEEGDPVYYRFEPVFVANLQPGGPAGMLQVAIEVMTRSPGVAETLAANDPMLRHHLLNLFESQNSAELMTLAGKQKLQAAVMDLVSAKLKELDQAGEIKGVYFTQLVMQ